MSEAMRCAPITGGIPAGTAPFSKSRTSGSRHIDMCAHMHSGRPSYNLDLQKQAVCSAERAHRYASGSSVLRGNATEAVPQPGQALQGVPLPLHRSALSGSRSARARRDAAPPLWPSLAGTNVCCRSERPMCQQPPASVR